MPQDLADAFIQSTTETTEVTTAKFELEKFYDSYGFKPENVQQFLLKIVHPCDAEFPKDDIVQLTLLLNQINSDHSLDDKTKNKLIIESFNQAIENGNAVLKIPFSSPNPGNIKQADRQEVLTEVDKHFSGQPSSLNKLALSNPGNATKQCSLSVDFLKTYTNFVNSLFCLDAMTLTEKTVVFNMVNRDFHLSCTTYSRLSELGKYFLIITQAQVLFHLNCFHDNQFRASRDVNFHFDEFYCLNMVAIIKPFFYETTLNDLIFFISIHKDFFQCLFDINPGFFIEKFCIEPLPTQSLPLLVKLIEDFGRLFCTPEKPISDYLTWQHFRLILGQRFSPELEKIAEEAIEKIYQKYFAHFVHKNPELLLNKIPHKIPPTFFERRLRELPALVGCDNVPELKLIEMARFVFSGMRETDLIAQFTAHPFTLNQYLSSKLILPLFQKLTFNCPFKAKFFLAGIKMALKDYKESIDKDFKNTNNHSLLDNIWNFFVTTPTQQFMSSVSKILDSNETEHDKAIELGLKFNAIFDKLEISLQRILNRYSILVKTPESAKLTVNPHLTASHWQKPINNSVAGLTA